MNRRGFTLVELLVVVAILGIITGMSIPLIRNIQMHQKNKQFSTYKDSLVASSKLYNNSYSIDLFGKRRTGCAVVSYKDLEKRNFIKDIKLKNTSCSKVDASGNSETYVVINKYLDNYYYNANLVCRSGNTIVYPNEESATPVECSSSGEGSMTIKAYPAVSGDYSEKQISNIKVYMESFSGYSVKSVYKPTIEYLFTTNSSLQEADYNSGSWKKFNFGNPKPEDEQLGIIASGHPINYNIGKLTAKDLSGEVHLYVRTKSLHNLLDESASFEETDGWTTNGEYHYKSIGTYKIDNEKPVVTVIEVKSQNSSYNTLNANLITTASDTYTQNSDLKICTSVDSDTCTTVNKFTSAYSSTKEVTVGNSYNGTTHNVFTHVMDRAGNISSVGQGSYTVSQQYQLTYDSDGGSTCNPASKTGFKNNTWGSLCSPTRTGYSFEGWYTSKNGSGMHITQNSTISSNLSVYAYWKRIYTVTLTRNTTAISKVMIDGVAVTGSKTYKEGTVITISAQAKDYYHFTKWSDNNNSITRRITVNDNYNLKAEGYKNVVITTYHTNGGKFINPTGSNCNRALIATVGGTTHTVNEDRGYLNTSLSSEGVYDYEEPCSPLCTRREGYTATKSWHCNATNGKLLDEDRKFAYYWEYVDYCGKLDDFKKRDVTIHLYADWIKN